MIGKQVKGRGFRGCLNYLLNKEGSQIIGGNMSGQTPGQLVAEFHFSRQINPRVERAVYHASLSVLASEQLSDDQWREIADDYLQQMGFTNNQFVIVRHTDTSHHHIHLVASRIRLDGSCVSDSWDYRRSEQIIRQLEKMYQLESPVLQNPDRRSPSTIERRIMRRTGETSIRQKLQDAIDKACETMTTLPELVNYLQKQAINTTLKFTRTGHVQGICYQLNEMTFNGTQLGKAYTFSGLQKYRGIDYQPLRDNTLLQNLCWQKIPPQKTKHLTLNNNDNFLTKVNYSNSYKDEVQSYGFKAEYSDPSQDQERTEGGCTSPVRETLYKNQDIALE